MMITCVIFSLVLGLLMLNCAITRQATSIMAKHPVTSDVVRQIGHGEAVGAADAYNWQVTMLDDAAQCSRRDA